MARRSPPRKVTYFEPVPPRLARNTIIESTFEVGRSFSCTIRVDCGQLDPGAVIRPVPGEWHPPHQQKAMLCAFDRAARRSSTARRRTHQAEAEKANAPMRRRPRGARLL